MTSEGAKGQGKWKAYHPNERALHHVKDKAGRVVRTIVTDLDQLEYAHLSAALLGLRSLHAIDNLYVKDVPTDEDLKNRSVVLEMASLMVDRIDFLFAADAEGERKYIHGGESSRRALDTARRHFQAMMDAEDEAKKEAKNK